MFWVGIVVSIALAVVGELLRPKQAIPNAKASALDDFDLPTAESGRILTVTCGRVRLDGSNVTWYGALQVVPLTKKVKTGWFSSAKQTYNWKYLMGIQHVLCFGRPDMKLTNIYFDDKKPKYTSAVQADGSYLITVDDEELFGGNETDGGVSGRIRFYPGNETQLPNAYMAEKLGEDVPAYKGVSYVMLEDFYLGTSKYIKPLAFEIASYPNQLGLTGNMHIVGEDANPICFIFEVLTEKVWGVGKPSSTIDIAKFREKAAVIFSEGMGMSMVYNGSSSAEELIGEILRHIDGVMYSDPQTGLITIDLARNDYSIADLEVFGEDDFVEAPKFSRPNWTETRNTLTVTFTDRSNDYEPTPLTFQDQANIMQRGDEIASESVDFGGFTTKEAVTNAGMRAMKVYAFPLAKLSGRLKRRAWKLRPCQVIIVNWPSLGLNSIVMRLTNVGYGNIKQNSVSIDSVEDIFSVGMNSYDPPAQSGWVNPARPPAALTRQLMIEAPYILTGTDDSFMAAFASPSGPLDLGVDIHLGSSAGSLVRTGQSDDFTSSGLLSASLAQWTASTSLSGLANTAELNPAPTAAEVAVGETLALIKGGTTEEWITYTGINLSTGALTGLQRGLFDTVPQAHAAGSQVWFPPTGFIEANELPIGNFPSTLYAKLLPYSALGALDPALGTTISAVANRRAARPYPPGRIRVNNTRPDLLAATVTSPFTLAWAHRSRVAQGAVTQDAASVTPEEGTTYTIRLRNGATVLFEKTGIGLTAAAASISCTFDGSLTVDIFAVRNGLASYQMQSYSFTHSKGAVLANAITADEAQYVLDGGNA